MTTPSKCASFLQTVPSGNVKHYFWPYTNRWWFDEESGRHRQVVDAVRPVEQKGGDAGNWPGFVRVELLEGDLSPTGVYNYVLPEQLYSERGHRIAPSEALWLLNQTSDAEQRRVSPQLSARTTKMSRLRRSLTPAEHRAQSKDLAAN